MNTTDLKKPFEQWINTALKDIDPSRSCKLANELTQHFDEIIKLYIHQGKTENDAHVLALQEMGNAEGVNVKFKKIHLTTSEAKWLALEQNIIADIYSTKRKIYIKYVVILVIIALAEYLLLYSPNSMGFFDMRGLLFCALFLGFNLATEENILSLFVKNNYVNFLAKHLANMIMIALFFIFWKTIIPDNIENKNIGVTIWLIFENFIQVTIFLGVVLFKPHALSKVWRMAWSKA